METLSKFWISTALLLMSLALQAQNITELQTAFSKSYIAENQKDFTQAIDEMKPVYKEGDYISNIRLGWLNYLAKQYGESITFYRKAIALKPYAIEARLGCVKPLSAIENWEKVKEQYQEILKIDPLNTTANYWLGVIYYNRKDYKSATNLFEKVVNLYPLDYDSVIMLAWTKLNTFSHTDAKLLFQQALIIRPNDISALSGLQLINKWLEANLKPLVK
ncbi:MAG: tetratricopeptide repeat protein [Prolixibacteraceae bacterium]|jgi:tetratricopeptide (TPR) repeat protein|nr:tetratricopeptide repeat protein [Prolixibacteraceae bacterium]